MAEFPGSVALRQSDEKRGAAFQEQRDRAFPGSKPLSKSVRRLSLLARYTPRPQLSRCWALMSMLVESTAESKNAASKRSIPRDATGEPPRRVRRGQECEIPRWLPRQAAVTERTDGPRSASDALVQRNDECRDGRAHCHNAVSAARNPWPRAIRDMRDHKQASSHESDRAGLRRGSRTLRVAALQRLALAPCR
jgi:hypothetical protein